MRAMRAGQLNDVDGRLILVARPLSFNIPRADQIAGDGSMVKALARSSICAFRYV
jgi:hypothetical protein